MKSEDRERGDAFRKSFVLQTNRVALEDLKNDEIQLRGMAQQVINEALYKGLHAKAQPKLESVEVLNEDHGRPHLFAPGRRVTRGGRPDPGTQRRGVPGHELGREIRADVATHPGNADHQGVGHQDWIWTGVRGRSAKPRCR